MWEGTASSRVPGAPHLSSSSSACTELLNAVAASTGYVEIAVAAARPKAATTARPTATRLALACRARGNVWIVFDAQADALACLTAEGHGCYQLCAVAVDRGRGAGDRTPRHEALEFKTRNSR